MKLAQGKLGLIYAKGLGVEKDLRKAAQWFTKAAQQGDVNAKANLQILQTAPQKEIEK